MKVREVVEAIIENSGVPLLEETCDTLKAGSMENEVHGIAVTFMATIEVIQKAAEAGADLIITHEPTFYEHMDHPEWLEGSALYQKKMELINRHGISIWRYHDYLHGSKPDIIFEGLLEELGWLDKKAKNNTKNTSHVHSIVELGGTSLREVVNHIKSKLQMQHVRIVGNPDTVCNRVGVSVGGGSIDMDCDLGHVMEEENLDVLICGDIVEWSIVPYVRDGAQLGLNKALIIVGHNRTEEVGMKYFAGNLEKYLKGLPVTMIESGEPFLYF